MQAFKALLRAIGIWIDKKRNGWHLVQGTDGRFYVRYPDGKRSQRFHYATACDYAELFGGDVVHEATGRVMVRRRSMLAFMQAVR